MIDSMIDPPCESEEQYYAEQMIVSYYNDAIDSIRQFMGGDFPFQFLSNLKIALKQKSEWSYWFAEECKLSHYEVAALRGDIPMMMDLLWKDRRDSLESSYCPD